MIGGKKIAAFCTSDMKNEDIQLFIYKLNSALEQRGWKLLVFNSCTNMYNGNTFDMGEACVFKLLDYDFIDAVVIYDRTIQQRCVTEDIIANAKKHDIPVFMLNEENSRDDVIDVFFDEGNAFRALIVHLIKEHNVSRFGCVAGFENNAASDRKIDILKKVTEEYGVTIDWRFFGHGNFYCEPTRLLVEKFLEVKDELPDAIVCVNDSMAIAVCDVLIENGIRVPDDVIVTGFDGIIQAEYNFPKITTCKLNLDYFADFFVKLLEDSHKGNQLSKNYYFPYTFEPSESCGCKMASAQTVNKAINRLYSKSFSLDAYERSMTNMISKISNMSNISEMDEIVKYYLKYDSYICLNADSDGKNRPQHTYDNHPFATGILANRFFCKEKEVISERIYLSSFVPDWNELLDRKGIITVCCIHIQQSVYGYMVTLVDDLNPADFEQAMQKIHRFYSNLNLSLSLFIQQNDLRKSNQILVRVQDKIISDFAELVESRDDMTGQHIKRTGEYIEVLVHHMAKLPDYEDLLTEREQELMCKAAPVHDIGKIKISDVILNKPGRLTNEEFDIIKTHTTEGGKIINTIMTDVEDYDYIKMANDMALYHHERWDGSGYPSQLSGDSIPLCARIMAVVDVFDALSSKRVYKDAYSLDKTFNIIEGSSGSHFDPKIVKAFLEIREEIEKIVRQNSN